MINLLPPEVKEDMRYARRNTRLLSWLFAFSLSLLGVGLIISGGLAYMQSSIRASTTEVENNKAALQTQKVGSTSKQLGEISNNTKLALQVLSREILFSSLLRQLGSSLPEGVVLQEFQVDTVLGGGLTLTAAATNVTTATQLQVNLSDPANKIFEKIDIEKISCTPPKPEVKYPCTAQFRTLFAQDNPFAYIAQPKTTKSGVKQ